MRLYLPQITTDVLRYPPPASVGLLGTNCCACPMCVQVVARSLASTRPKPSPILLYVNRLVRVVIRMVNKIQVKI